MAFDFKKEYKEFYLPPNRPEIVTVPSANFLAVRGEGDPNEPDGAYKRAIGLLYAVAFTLKMSQRCDHRIEGFYAYIVPPLEGLWRQDGRDGIDYTDKAAFRWVSVIRLPEFVTEPHVAWARERVAARKGLDCSAVEFATIDEGLCVQMLHVGSFDSEPASVARMDAYLKQNGYVNDFSEGRMHHEIYLSDARKVEPERWRTVIRHPIKKG